MMKQGTEMDTRDKGHGIKEDEKEGKEMKRSIRWRRVRSEDQEGKMTWDHVEISEDDDDEYDHESFELEEKNLNRRKLGEKDRETKRRKSA